MLNIDVSIVARLIEEQFPEWSALEIRPVQVSGHDNRTFHLGEHMSVRLPSAAGYVAQVEKEHRWLPILSKQLSLPISQPVAMGRPNDEYPWPWSINKWLEGEALLLSHVEDLDQLARDLGAFLMELQSVDATEGPPAGVHNFHRGGSLSVYDEDSRTAIANNIETFDAEVLQAIWSQALASAWRSEPVWVHGDVAPGNLLVQEGKLCAVIDFGVLGVGDPACDAAMAWTFFDASSREIFKQALYMDEETWDRARGWALWKALITYDGSKDTDKARAEEAYYVIQTVMDEYACSKRNRGLR
ncbi:aminoglycoside phosphotransferase family protein [Paenibacillus guangzhouensis]|uniref:aminoglycoside phosphotransferase family protein n=1 Tax=Paenibacillus guangzhouensis TaxID=1473112 RepID=UPI0012675093|nr:aminoglycoside phosphotransferase family protein [Paenibacillus guangzhouensis]